MPWLCISIYDSVTCVSYFQVYAKSSFHFDVVIFDSYMYVCMYRTYCVHFHPHYSLLCRSWSLTLLFSPTAPCCSHNPALSSVIFLETIIFSSMCLHVCLPCDIFPFSNNHLFFLSKIMNTTLGTKSIDPQGCWDFFLPTGMALHSS